MAKGNEAKDLVIKKIQDAFGADFVGVYDKKVYLWSKEDGVRQQVCLTLTCPKAPVGEGNETLSLADGLDFEAMDSIPVAAKPVDISDKEKQNIEDLMRKLGL